MGSNSVMKHYNQIPVVVVFLICSATSAAAIAEEAEDCALYEGTFPNKTMHRTMSTGVMQKGFQFAASLSLTSSTTGVGCEANFFGEVVAVSCAASGLQLYNWEPKLFKERDVSELWVHVGRLRPEGDADEGSSTDLTIIGRRGVHRGHILFPSTGLQPPITVRWKEVQPIAYYYNCVTGCLLTKNAVTPPGSHTVFFRPRENFEYLYITYNSTEHRNVYEISLNVSDIVMDSQWRNVTVVWNKVLGGIGLLVDSQPIRGLGKFSSLSDKSRIEAEVNSDGGQLRICDQSFKKVTDVSYKGNLQNVSCGTSSQNSRDSSDSEISKNWLVIFALVCIGLLLAASIILLILLLRTKRDLQREKEISGGNNIAVVAFEGSRATSPKNATSLYTKAQSSPHDNHDGSKGQVPPVSSANTNHYVYTGLKT